MFNLMYLIGANRVAWEVAETTEFPFLCCEANPSKFFYYAINPANGPTSSSIPRKRSAKGKLFKILIYGFIVQFLRSDPEFSSSLCGCATYGCLI